MPEGEIQQDVLTVIAPRKEKEEKSHIRAKLLNPLKYSKTRELNVKNNRMFTPAGGAA